MFHSSQRTLQTSRSSNHSKGRIPSAETVYNNILPSWHDHWNEHSYDCLWWRKDLYSYVTQWLGFHTSLVPKVGHCGGVGFHISNKFSFHEFSKFMKGREHCLQLQEIDSALPAQPLNSYQVILPSPPQWPASWHWHHLALDYSVSPWHFPKSTRNDVRMGHPENK